MCFCEPIMSRKNPANHAAAISHKHWCEAALEKLDCLREGGDSQVSGCTRLDKRVMQGIETFQIFSSDPGRFLCVNTYFGASRHLIFCFKSNMVNNTEKVWNLQKAFSLLTIKVWRFETIDGVKYVYCIKHAFKFLLREQVGFAAVLWRLRQCVLSINYMYTTCICQTMREFFFSLATMTKRWPPASLDSGAANNYILVYNGLQNCVSNTNYKGREIKKNG